MRMFLHKGRLKHPCWLLASRARALEDLLEAPHYTCNYSAIREKIIYIYIYMYIHVYIIEYESHRASQILYAAYYPAHGVDSWDVHCHLAEMYSM